MVAVFVGALAENITADVTDMVAACIIAVGESVATHVTLMVGVIVYTGAKRLSAYVAAVISILVSTLVKRLTADITAVVSILVYAGTHYSTAAFAAVVSAFRAGADYLIADIALVVAALVGTVAEPFSAIVAEMVLVCIAAYRGLIYVGCFATDKLIEYIARAKQHCHYRDKAYDLREL